VPALISLMKTRDRTVESLALLAVCGPGHTGAAAFPYIEKRLRGNDPAFDILGARQFDASLASRCGNPQATPTGH
jgi:hypothetical protein